MTDHDERSAVPHFDNGDFSAREDDGDDVKLLGVYSTPDRVKQRISTARNLPGFRDEPDCFWYAEYEVDEDAWVSGYVTER
ncbi:hypothetical protein [Nonomuraea sp. NPDC050786]|uniref:hypothetical protein n=1 Tax=Nonomuraea sp. NPDC050786 TaxID=3154840 RepID=UPI0033D962F5